MCEVNVAELVINVAYGLPKMNYMLNILFRFIFSFVSRNTTPHAQPITLTISIFWESRNLRSWNVCEVHVAGLVVRVGHAYPNLYYPLNNVGISRAKIKTQLDMLLDLDVTIWLRYGFFLLPCPKLFKRCRSSLPPPWDDHQFHENPPIQLKSTQERRTREFDLVNP
jgi:hypothetical protein